jgi:hypothetical protein
MGRKTRPAHDERKGGGPGAGAIGSRMAPASGAGYHRRDPERPMGEPMVCAVEGGG